MLWWHGVIFTSSPMTRLGMKMKKVICLLSLSVILTGCVTSGYEKRSDFESASTLQQKRDVLIKWIPFTYAKEFPPIRQELIQKTGENEMFLTGLVAQCYTSGYDKCAYDYYIRAIEQADDEQCDKTTSCVKQRDISRATNQLNSTYYLVMARNQYDQSWFDLNLRTLCKSAGIAQRNGISLDKIKYDVEQQPGLSPEVRGQFRDVAVSCWVLSKNGIQDGTTTIKNIY